MYTYIHACIHTYTHAYLHAYINTYMHTYIYTYIHTYQYTHTHTYIIQTYIHKKKHIRRSSISTQFSSREYAMLPLLM